MIPLAVRALLPSGKLYNVDCLTRVFVWRWIVSHLRCKNCGTVSLMGMLHVGQHITCLSIKPCIKLTQGKRWDDKNREKIHYINVCKLCAWRREKEREQEKETETRKREWKRKQGEMPHKWWSQRELLNAEGKIPVNKYYCLIYMVSTRLNKYTVTESERQRNTLYAGQKKKC